MFGDTSAFFYFELESRISTHFDLLRQAQWNSSMQRRSMCGYGNFSFIRFSDSYAYIWCKRTTMQPNKQELEDYYRTHESERLVFRNADKNDVELWLPFFEDEVALSQVGMLSGRFKSMTNYERANAWISRLIERRENDLLGQLIVTEKETGSFLGLGGIIYREEPEALGEWEIAYSLLPEARGKGYATELAIFFRDWAFENSRVESVVSFVHIDNAASQRVTEKNGMHVEKELTFFEMPCRLNRVKREAVVEN